jgi:hypothetical protein
VLEGDGNGIEHTDEVDVDRINEGRGLMVLDREDAGVTHNDVEVAQLCDAGGDCVAQFAALAHIGLASDEAAIHRLDEGDHLGELFGRALRVGDRVHLTAEVDGDDVGAFLSQANRVAAPLSTCCARD